MELVYLWVEKYKNIENQGFNFSSRFKCSYENNEIKIIDKEETKEPYLKNFFGENINVTAIVGENGTGKTAILHELLNVGDFEKIKRTKIYAYDKETEKVEHISYKTLHEDKTQVILFDEDIDSLSHTNAHTIDNLIDIKDRYKKNNVVIALFGFDKKQYTIGHLTFIPTHLEITLNNKVYFDSSKLLRLKFEYDDHQNDTIGHISVSESDLYNLKEFIQKELNKSIQLCESTLNIRDYMYLKEFIYKLNNRDKNTINVFRELVLSSFSDYKFINTLEEELYKETNEKNFQILIKRLNRFIKINGINASKIFIDLSNKDVEQILKNANRDFFDIDFFKIINQKNIYFKHLSSGEQKLVLLFGKLNYVVRKINMKDKENFILLLDEPDVYLHPNWQKKLISYFINFIENNKYLNEKNIHIVISSHSPFILSDLPKENVIFLENGKQEDVNIDTFGANIHTLLSHGFFMKDGLMGEFAKGKIEDVINYLNDKESSIKDNDEAQKLLNIIGEPIIKNQLQKMLESKRLSKVDEIDKIKSDMKNLAKRLEELEND